MEATLLPGDEILVTKLSYGARIPAFLQNSLFKVSRLPGLSKVKLNDVVVFYSTEFPHYALVKRCVALPADTLLIKNTDIYVNGRLLKTINLMFDYILRPINVQRAKRIIDSLHFRVQFYNKFDHSYILELSETQAAHAKKLFKEPLFYKKIKKHNDIEDLFPSGMHTQWNPDNYGPLLIPAKGLIMKMDVYTIKIYRDIIAGEGNSIKVDGNNIYINGIQSRTYTFKRNYFFMMGDNRHQSHDSRWIGFIPEENITGKATLIAYSKDPKSGDLRANRILKPID